MAEPVRDDGRGRAEPSASEASARAAGDELTGSGMTLNPAVLAGDGAPPRLALPPPASPSHELFADPAASLYAGANRTLLALHAGLLAPGSGRGEDDLRQATTGHDGQLEGLEAAEEQGPSDYRRLLLSRTTSAPTSGDAVSSRLLQALPQLSLSHWLLDVNSQAPHRSSSSAGQSNDLGGNEEPTRNSEESVASPLLPVRQAWAAATPRSRRRSVGSILSRHEIGVRRARDSSQVQSRHSFDAAASGSSNPATTESAATTPVEHTTNDEHADNDDQTAMEELVSLFRRCHHSLPFVALFLIYFAYQHATGILVFVVGTIAIIGLDQRVRTQVALKDKASILQLLGIVGMCAIDMVALCTVDGEPNPFLHFSRMMELSSSHKGALWDVLWIILVNDFMIRLCSLSIKAIVAAIKSDKLVCRKGPGNDYVLPSDADVDTPSVHSDADDDGIDPLSAAPRATSSVAFYRRKRKLYGIIEMCSIFLRSLLAGIPWCSYYQLCSSQFMADVFTFAYLFMKGLILGTQGRRIFTLVRSFVTLGLEFGVYVSPEDLVEAGSPDCSICYESMHLPVKLSCSHMFCEECVMEWFDRERSCPLCRASVGPAGPAEPEDGRPQFLDGSTSLVPQLL